MGPSLASSTCLLAEQQQQGQQGMSHPTLFNKYLSAILASIAWGWIAYIVAAAAHLSRCMRYWRQQCHQLLLVDLLPSPWCLAAAACSSYSCCLLSTSTPVCQQAHLVGALCWIIYFLLFIFTRLSFSSVPRQVLWWFAYTSSKMQWSEHQYILSVARIIFKATWTLISAVLLVESRAALAAIFLSDIWNTVWIRSNRVCYICRSLHLVPLQLEPHTLHHGSRYVDISFWCYNLQIYDTAEVTYM